MPGWTQKALPLGSGPKCIPQRFPISQKGEGIMKRLLSMLLILLLCFSSCASAEGLLNQITEALRALLSGKSEYVVGEDIALADITDFYYTYDSSTNPPDYQRYRFYAEDGAFFFYHEKREGDHWPLTEEDVTVSGTLALSDAQAEEFFDLLSGGTVKSREENLNDGDAGPWLYLYWTGDPGDYQEFSFRSWDTEWAFEDFCQWLKELETAPPDAPAAGGTAVLTFDSFDGGGPEYSVTINDPSVVSCSRDQAYNSTDHEEMDGAGYKVTFLFTAQKPGETQATVTSWSPLAGSEAYVYELTVDEALNLRIRLLACEDLDAFVRSVPTLVIEINRKVFYADLEDNPSADAFIRKLSPQFIEVALQAAGDFEKAGQLPWSLPESVETITAKPGDLILLQESQIALCCSPSAGDYTLLARIGTVTGEELLEAFGGGDAQVTFWLEWSE